MKTPDGLPSGVFDFQVIGAVDEFAFCLIGDVPVGLTFRSDLKLILFDHQFYFNMRMELKNG